MRCTLQTNASTPHDLGVVLAAWVVLHWGSWPQERVCSSQRYVTSLSTHDDLRGRVCWWLSGQYRICSWMDSCKWCPADQVILLRHHLGNWPGKPKPQVPSQSHEVCSYSLRLAKCIEFPVNVKTEAMCFLLMGMSQGSCESTLVISWIRLLVRKLSFCFITSIALAFVLSQLCKSLFYVRFHYLFIIILLFCVRCHALLPVIVGVKAVHLEPFPQTLFTLQCLATKGYP